MKLTRRMLNDPLYTHTKIISIEKDYHMNVDTEQKRPLLLARSVDMYMNLIDSVGSFNP